MTEQTATQPEATVTPITPTTPTRATWKQHGRPTGGFEFFGTEVKSPATKAVQVAKVETGPNGITLKGGNGRVIRDATFAAATKFWAVVPAEAPRQVDEPKPPKAESTPAAPVEITAPKGGDKTVPPIKDAIAKAIKDSGSNILAISRAHGLNPAQMRRLSLNQVAKVDLVRAEAIAAALGKNLADLFGEATDKAKAAPKGNQAAAQMTAQAEAAKAAQDAEAEAGQPEAPEGTQADQAE
jgi:ribosomal protein L12E/L44/L45/RPP1/RPP2